MQKIGVALTFLFLVTFLSKQAWAHCEIPCGIYTDELRIEMIEEDCKTIEKSMAQISELSAAADADRNQLVRWVTNKEDHANKIQHVVTQYFMTQRIKPDQADYEKKITLLHQILVAAMKCKQTTDPAHVQAIRELSAAFSALYFVPAEPVAAPAAPAAVDAGHDHSDHSGHAHE